jgi:endonuclease G
MTRPKKSTAASKRSATSKSFFSSRVKRFTRALVVAGVASFGVGSFLLNPQWESLLSGKWPSDWNVSSSAQTVVTQVQNWLPSLFDAEPNSSPTHVAGPTVQTQFTECKQFFPSHQPPLVPAAEKLRELCFSGFAILHNGSTKTPMFVAERLNRRLLTQAQGLERTDRFYADARLPRAERAELADYRGSGYSRGHMAPAANMTSKEAMAQSFSLANMVPQDQKHNGGAWSRVEQDTRKYVLRASGDVYIFTGPVFSGRVKKIGEGGVAVPSHIYKLIYDASTDKAWAYWQANHPDTTGGAPISYQELVKRTGIHFLDHDVPLAP